MNKKYRFYTYHNEYGEFFQLQWRLWIFWFNIDKCFMTIDELKQWVARQDQPTPEKYTYL